MYGPNTRTESRSLLPCLPTPIQAQAAINTGFGRTIKTIEALAASITNQSLLNSADLRAAKPAACPFHQLTLPSVKKHDAYKIFALAIGAFWEFAESRVANYEEQRLVRFNLSKGDFKIIDGARVFSEFDYVNVAKLPLKERAIAVQNSFFDTVHRLFSMWLEEARLSTNPPVWLEDFDALNSHKVEVFSDDCAEGKKRKFHGFEAGIDTLCETYFGLLEVAALLSKPFNSNPGGSMPAGLMKNISALTLALAKAERVILGDFDQALIDRCFAGSFDESRQRYSESRGKFELLYNNDRSSCSLELTVPTLTQLVNLSGISKHETRVRCPVIAAIDSDDIAVVPRIFKALELWGNWCVNPGHQT